MPLRTPEHLDMNLIQQYVSVNLRNERPDAPCFSRKANRNTHATRTSSLESSVPPISAFGASLSTSANTAGEMLISIPNTNQSLIITPYLGWAIMTESTKHLHKVQRLHSPQAISRGRAKLFEFVSKWMSVGCQAVRQTARQLLVVRQSLE